MKIIYYRQRVEKKVPSQGGGDGNISGTALTWSTGCNRFSKAVQQRSNIGALDKREYLGMIRDQARERD